MSDLTLQTNLYTDRLALAIVNTGDHAFMLELLNSKGWIEFIGDRHVYSAKEAITFIDKTNNTPNLTYWVVRLKADQTPVGIISFLKREYLKHFDIGFSFLPQHNGNGYAYEAAYAVMQILKRYPEHTTLLATSMPSNKNSLRLLTKLGFRFDHELRFEKETMYVYLHDQTI